MESGKLKIKSTFQHLDFGLSSLQNCEKSEYSVNEQEWNKRQDLQTGSTNEFS